MEILEEYREKLEKWFAFRENVELVKSISQVTTEDAFKRLEKPVSRALGRENGDREIYASIETAVDKAVEKLLFGLRDTLPRQDWKNMSRCPEGISSARYVKDRKGKEERKTWIIFSYSREQRREGF